jgi:hypothetical protein
MGKRRFDIGLNRTPCDRCRHREDQHYVRDGGLRLCIVCDRQSQDLPCSATSLGGEPTPP